MASIIEDIPDEEEDEDPSAIRPVKIGSAKMSDADFEAARDAYEHGTSGISELARVYGVSRNALYKRFERAKVVKGSKTAPAAPPAPIIKRFVTEKEEWIETTRMEGYQALRQAQLIARKIAADCLKASKPLATVDDDLRAAGRLNKIVIDNVRSTLDLLRADEHVDEEDLPILTIEDLTQDEILKHHRSTGALEADENMDALDADDDDDDLDEEAA